MEWPLELRRQRLAWWLVGLCLFAVVGALATTYVGTFVLGLFIYYGTRPMCRRFESALGHRGLAATLTLLAIVVPALLLLGYVGLVAVRELTAALDPALLRLLSERVGLAGTISEAVREPLSYLSQGDRLNWLRERIVEGFGPLRALSTFLTHLTLALALSFFLLRDAGRVERWFRREVAGDGSVAHAYFSAVDADLETVYFGNVITVLLVTVLSAVVYNGYNAVTPAAVTLPFPSLLALLTGLATFVPLVVGKLVYVPAAGYLTWRAVEADASLLWAPAAFLVVAFLFLDILPQTVLQPLISGRSLHTGLVLFAYVLGTAYFGWYGLFLGPLLLVLVVQFLNVVVPELLHGDPLTPAPSRLLHLGHDPTDGPEGEHAGGHMDADEDAGDPAAALSEHEADENGNAADEAARVEEE